MFRNWKYKLWDFIFDLGLPVRTLIHKRHFPAFALITDDHIVVTMHNGEKVRNDLSMHPWLVEAIEKAKTDPVALEALCNVEYLPFSIWWPDIDEGLDIEGMRRQIPSYIPKPK